MRWFLLVLMMVFWTGTAEADLIVTAHVQVVDSPRGSFVPLEIGARFWGSPASMATWHEFPEFVERAMPLHFWQVYGAGWEPIASNGIVSFEVITDGLVLMAVTDRWYHSGSSGGDVDWIPQLTSRDELIEQGWAEVAAGMLVWDHKLDCISGTGHIVFRRDSLAGESFTCRTEKYIAPMLLTTQFVPEPSTLLLLATGGAVIVWLRRRRRSGPI